MFTSETDTQLWHAHEEVQHLGIVWCTQAGDRVPTWLSQEAIAVCEEPVSVSLPEALLSGRRDLLHPGLLPVVISWKTPGWA